MCEQHIYTVKYIGNNKEPDDHGSFFNLTRGNKYKVYEEAIVEDIKVIRIEGFGRLEFPKKFFIQCKDK